MKFADFKKGPGAQVFAGLGEGGFWLDDLEHAKDWRDLRDRVLASNSNTSESFPGRFAKAVRRYASVCSRGERELLKGICLLCDFAALADEISAGEAWQNVTNCGGDFRRALAACIVNADH